MAKVKVRVLHSVIDGKGHGETVQIDERSAKALVANGYVELVKEAETKESAPKSEQSSDTDDAPKKKKRNTNK